MNKEMQRHLGNISRSVGHDVSGRYSYIINESDLINAWLQMHNDLDYPLMMTSKYRRALIYNKQGLEEQIQNMITKQMEVAFNSLADMITKDIENQLNNVTQLANGNIVLGKNVNNTKTFTSSVINAAAKGIINGFFNVIDDIINYEEDNNRGRR